jgi:glycosyltransferase involved in cell wall biosynthesis
MVPYEAFLSGKPVVTTRDAGGPLEVVIDRETGTVTAAAAASIADGVARLLNSPDRAKEKGERGRKVAETVTWDSTIERLLAAAR